LRSLFYYLRERKGFFQKINLLVTDEESMPESQENLNEEVQDRVCSSQVKLQLQ